MYPSDVRFRDGVREREKASICFPHLPINPPPHPAVVNDDQEYGKRHMRLGEKTNNVIPSKTTLQNSFDPLGGGEGRDFKPDVNVDEETELYIYIDNNNKDHRN